MVGVTVEAALSLWDEVLENIEYRTMPLSVTVARDYVLAETITLPHDVPHFNKSAMDGYGLIYEDGRRNYIIDGIIGAGVVWNAQVPLGHAVRIMTGAMVPTMCDTVVMQEQCKTDGHIGSTLEIQGQITKGSHIIYQGEDGRKGLEVIPEGTVITTAVQAVLMGLGYEMVEVYRKPRVLVLTSGREVIDPGLKLVPGKIYNSNRVMLQGFLKDLGVVETVQYHVTDDPVAYDDELEAIIRLARDCDIIVSSGGVSVGLYDTLPKMYTALGAKVLYGRIQMRPGAASYGAVTPKGQLIFGLSGNPGAAFNGWHLLVKPVLQRYLGREGQLGKVLLCSLGEGIEKKNPFDRYVQGSIVFEKGRPVFYKNCSNASCGLVGLVTVNALAKIPKGVNSVSAGEDIEVHML